MHSFVYRLNTIVTFAVVILAALCGAASFLDGLNSPSVHAHAEVLKIDRFRKNSKGNDEVKLRLNVSMDLQSLFTWNTKQVFVFLTAEYKTSKNSVNQVSLWDHIILDRDHAKFQARISNPHPFVDQGSNLLGKEVELVLHWHVMPKTGRMIQDKMALSHFFLPEAYT